MKYKNIYSVIHNLGHSFLSLMNYVDGIYVIDDLSDINSKGHDIEIDWFNEIFTPEQEATPAIITSINQYVANLKNHLHSQNVDVDRLTSLKLFCPARGSRSICAEDDRGKIYKIYIY